MIKELTIDYSQYCSVLSPTELISVSMVQAQLVAIKSEIEELKSQIKELREQNQLLLNENLALKERIAKLSKTSSNSSKPPSSDLTKKKPKKKGQGKLGGQQGHPKHERLPFSKDEVDCFHPYKLNCCPDCNGQVIITCGPPRIIQQFEIVESPLVRHEHQSFPAWCETCQKLHYTDLYISRKNSCYFFTAISWRPQKIYKIMTVMAKLSFIGHSSWNL